MINILLSGACGRMGQAITTLCEDFENLNISCGYDSFTGKEMGYPVYDSYDKITESVDVIIDFSNPTNTENILAFAKEKNIPCIIATTGLSGEQKALMEETSMFVPVFFSANMSLGVNLLISLAEKAAQILGDKFDIEIIEKHHNQKLDAPSGTALAIADAIAESLETAPQYVYDRHSVRKKRDKNEIGIHAVRGGTIVGEHDVIFAGNNEIIEINHRATSREIFATGALKAAEFIYGKPSGMYSMKDLFAE
ncbi:MAG: 4-hydroxy-tetrahydrodipicolinate reductase [Clostridia bacterium]|nr:4-hydroxy-tetrahydrodipicolinate reductase [Clostridia bacterium]MBR6647634.1 4-hydroxy-tetrahydrodipicolinate reductase [Clostridia bacterium]